MNPPSTLKTLSARLRRFQFLVGIGFAAAVAGALISAALLDRLRPRLEELGPGVLSLFVYTLASRLWVLGMLPLVCYGAARVAELRPWRTAIGAGLAGELFYLALDLVTVGFEGLAEQWRSLVLRALTLALGILFARRAVVRGRAAAERAVLQAQVAAKANQAKYDELLRESERVAERSESAKSERRP